MRWSAAEAAEIVEAARNAPVHSAAKPWVLELHGRSVYLYEVPQRPKGIFSGHDPLGLDRLLSCGAALEHIVLAIRVAGWHAKVVFPHDHANPDLLAVVRADVRERPTPAELDCHRAIRSPDATGGGDARRLVVANRWAGTELHPLDADTLVVLTVDDRRSDHVRGGAALQAALLAGRSAGVAVRPVIHLMHRAEWRAGLIERHDLAGFPQALVSVGAKDLAEKVPTAAGPTTASADEARS
ncbi:hypothetical protein Lesp02_75400 [Lentzea sp. NBRC 105346]|uniref:hypothetical protein n=1 Tax=Lentzea sp. NBRC 105346 TaxID=3032205 RepID=UPI0024A443A2|nr:hypothetical protein [Lentzea sp. NBRC 105346]GLZ35353.1 hypothetical protein Lesp02_75400 [Lentzea sp. NBRC 105346]